MNSFIKTYTLILFLLSATFAHAQNKAKEHFQKATAVLSSENIEMTMSIEVTDAKGRLKAKELNIVMAAFEDADRTKVVFDKPDRAKGTTIVITEKPNEIGIIEVYTPSNGKTRKLKATNSNMNMMGAEFNMAGFANYDADKLIYKLLNDTIVSGTACYQIQVSGTDSKNHASARLVIEQASYKILQTTRYDAKGQVQSFTQLFDYERVEGDMKKMYPTRIIVRDEENDKHATMRISGLKLRTDLTKAMFEL